MPVDASIYGQFLQRPKSVMDYEADYDQAQTRKNALQLAAMDLSEKTQANQRATQVRNALMGLGGAATDEQRINALMATATPEGLAQADALRKTGLERQKTEAQVAKDKASAGHSVAQTDDANFKLRIAKSDQAIKDISSFQTPQQALASLEQHAAAGDIAPEQAQVIRQTLTTLNPADFPKWQLGMVQNILTAKERMQYLTPDANTVATNTTSRANNAATNETHVQTTAMTNKTSRQNNADTIAGENTRAGVTAGGALDDNGERTAQGIANGQLPAPTGMALLNPKNQRILGRVMEINPQYDATTVSAKRAAATAFTSGNQGNAMRSFAVAGQHLDQLGQLVDALDNGNMQLVNKLGNIVSQQTGSPNVTNFDAAKEVVSKEVMKALIGSGAGGVQERAELAHSMENAKSPKQLKGVIAQYRTLMGAQHDALLVQRRAAGLPDSTLPKYDETPAANPAPAAGMPDANAIDAELKRRQEKK